MLMNLKYIIEITLKSLPAVPTKRIRRYLTFENFSILAGSVFLIAGMVFINKQIGIFHIASAKDSGTFLSESKPLEIKPVRIEGKPATIEVVSVGINLPIVDGYYDYTRASWTLTLDKAQFGVMTALANNQSGNTYIYGHNRKGVFMSLPGVKVGDIAKVTTENNKVFTYRFREAVTTTPSDASLLAYDGSPILSLQTCTGFRYKDRTLFIFDFEKVES